MGIRLTQRAGHRMISIRGAMAWFLAWLLLAPFTWNLIASGKERSAAGPREIGTLHDFVDACEGIRQDISLSGLKDLSKLRDGLRQFSRGNYAATSKTLEDAALQSGISLGDYALYYRGLALKSVQNRAGALRIWQQLLSEYPRSPMAAKAAVRLSEAALDRGDYQAAGSVLRDFRDLKDPQVLICMARASAGLKDYQAAGQLLEAIYFDFPLSDEAREAGTLLQSMRQTGKLRPAWDYARHASRMEALLADSRSSTAYAESNRLPVPQQEPQRSMALLIKGKCSFAVNRFSGAITLLKMIGPADPAIHAQALLYLALCQRKLNQFDRFILTCRSLQNQYPDSKSAEEALFNLANHYFLKERAAEASEVYRWLADRFPGGEFASQAHWKLIWTDYQTGNYSRAIDGIFVHLDQFRESPYRRAAFYWLGRSFEQIQDRGCARAVFEALVGFKANDYYSLLAERAQAACSGGSVETLQPPGDAHSRRLNELLGLARTRSPRFPAGYRFNEPVIRRILELSAADLPQQALSEIALLEGERGFDLGVQMLKAQVYAQMKDRWNAVRTLSRAIPQYASMEVDQLPRQAWEVFYPLEHWKVIQASSRKLRLDPLLVAALIRQESLFNPSARSKARAMGLMQIIPPTGVGLARRLQTAFSISRLYNGEYNIRLGTLHLSDLLNRYKGQLHQALAAYNAGQGRVDRWNEDLPRESEEFVESIPFTETRDYVKRIFTHWTHYRQLYSE